MTGARAWQAAGAAALVGLSVGALGAQTFRSRIDLVYFAVVVQDRRGNYVTDLTLDDFAVLEDGKPQVVRFFARGGDVTGGAALHLGLLMDTSASMESDMKLARTAAIKFLNALPEAADMTVVDFDTEVRAARYGQADFPRLVERIRSRRADGWTALYDAIGVYLDSAFDLEGRKIAVVYTDGGDTRSRLGFTEALDLVKGSDVTVYAVGFMAHQPSSVRLDQQMRLQQMAEVSGGAAFFPTTDDDLDKAYEKVLADIRSQYHLGYVSTNTKADGTWREVSIRLTKKDPRGLKVRTRKGYFAPYRESQPRSLLP